MSDDDRIRAEVSKTYGAAVRGESCCCGGGKAKTKGIAASFAGYGAQELADLPDDAVVNSFGCGNPLAFAEVRAGETVIDLGSGAGIDLLLAARKVGPQGRVIGVDMTDDMIEAARRNIASAGLTHVEVRKGIIEDLPVETATADWVISNCVINLSPDKPRVFAEIARVLRPGGRMMVSDIVADELPDWIRESAQAYSACLGGAISEADYVAGLKAAGLVDVEVRERIVYDAAQLGALIESEEMGAAFSCCCGGGGPPRALVQQAVGEVAGKVWSAKFFARKP
jgi:SAM-dependent methyltransferase